MESREGQLLATESKRIMHYTNPLITNYTTSDASINQLIWIRIASLLRAYKMCNYSIAFQTLITNDNNQTYRDHIKKKHHSFVIVIVLTRYFLHCLWIFLFGEFLTVTYTYIHMYICT